MTWWSQSVKSAAAASGLFLACFHANAQSGDPSMTPARPESAAPSDAPLSTSPSPSDAQTTPADGVTASVGSDWTIEINPRLWWVSPSGDLKLPGGQPDKVDVKHLDLDTPEFTPAGSFAINADRFRFTFLGATYSRSADSAADSAFQLGGLNIAGGDQLDTDFDFSIFDLTVGYRFYSRDFKETTRNKAEAADLKLDLYALAGARLYDLDIQVRQSGSGSGRAGIDEFFIEPIIGVRSEMTIIRDFTMNLQLDGGGFGDSDQSSFSFNISVDFQWRPAPWIGVQIGWRQVLYSFSDGSGVQEFEYDGAMAGLFTGVVFKF